MTDPTVASMSAEVSELTEVRAGEVSPKLEMLVEGLFIDYRTQGLTESQAFEAIDRGDRLWHEDGAGEIDGNPGGRFRGWFEGFLGRVGLLEPWPVRWTTEGNEKLAMTMTLDDVIWRISQVVDLPRERLLLALLLSAQGHLAPFLREIGPAIHAVFQGPRYAAGKSRGAKAFTILGSGKWLDAATPAYVRAARAEGPKILGIDEGDEAEKENPGLKAIILESHNWDAVYGKFSEPGEKGRRAPEEIPFGGPIFITFRARPWPPVASRAIIFDMERSSRSEISDSGAVMESFLEPCKFWLRDHARMALDRRDPTWAKLRIHEPDFLALLDRISKDLPTLRHRDKARTLLFIAESLGIELEKEIREAMLEEEDESENQTIIEAILSDAFFSGGGEIAFEGLRLNVQKTLKDAHENLNLSRNKFAAVLKEMGFVKNTAMWKRVTQGDRVQVMLYPAEWARHKKEAAKEGATP